MKKLMDKFKAYFKVNKRLFLFLSILLVIGIVAGSIFSVILKEEDSILVKEYLINYLNSISKSEINLNDSFVSSVLSQLLITVIIWLLGFSIIGIPIIFLLYFYKSFIFGFTVGSILINFKTKGILLSIIYMIPHHIIKLIIMMVLIIYAYQISIKLLRAILKKGEINFKNITSIYFYLLIINIGLDLILNAYSSYLVPKIIKLLLPMIS